MGNALVLVPVWSKESVELLRASFDTVDGMDSIDRRNCIEAIRNRVQFADVHARAAGLEFVMSVAAGGDAEQVRAAAIAIENSRLTLPTV